MPEGQHVFTALIDGQFPCHGKQYWIATASPRPEADDYEPRTVHLRAFGQLHCEKEAATITFRYIHFRFDKRTVEGG